MSTGAGRESNASVVIPFADPADALHGRAVVAFRTFGSHDVVLPAGVYAEVLFGPLRGGQAAVESLEPFIREFAMQMAPLSAELARGAAALPARHASLRLPDAFVLATANALRAAVVLTGDELWAS